MMNKGYCSKCEGANKAITEGFFCHKCKKGFCNEHYKDHDNCIPFDIRVSPLKKFSDHEVLFETDKRRLVSFKHERFGKMIMSWIKNMDGFHHFEESEDIMEIAGKCGLAKQVFYDPKKHGDIEYSDPGDQIWWYGDD